MRPVKIHILCAFTAFCFLHVGLSAQKNKIDSLKNVLVNLKDDTNKVNLLNNLCRQYIKKRDRDSAEIFARKALTLSKKLNFQVGEAKSLLLISNIINDEVKSIGHLMNAAAILEDKNEPVLKYKIYHSIAQINNFNGNYELAMKNYQKALQFALQSKDSAGIAGVYGGLGIAYHDMKNEKKAVEFYNKSINIYRKINDSGRIAIALGNLSNVYIEEKNYTAAAEALNESVELFRALKSEHGVALRISTLGKVYVKLGKKSNALKCLVEGRELSVKTNYDLAISENMDAFMEYYAFTGNYQKAFEAQSNYIKYKDSTFNTEQSATMANAQFKYETIAMEKIKKLESEKKEIEFRDQLKQRNIIIYASGIGFIMTLCFAFFILRAYRQKQKTNILLSDKNKIIEEKQKEILESIRYAKRIQNALIPSERYIHKSIARLTKEK